MFGGKNVCRGFEYFINTLSIETVELGTLEYPFKEINSAFLELVNIHANTNRNISIYVLEDTINYIRLKTAYVLNINNVTLTTYSKSALISSKATIIGVDSDSYSSIFGESTLFNIIKNTTLLVNKQLAANLAIDEFERGTVSGEYAVILIQRSNFRMSQLDIISMYNSITSTYYFLQLIAPNGKLFHMSDMSINVSGFTLYAAKPTNVILENIKHDMYRAQGGLYFNFV